MSTVYVARTVFHEKPVRKPAAKPASPKPCAVAIPAPIKPVCPEHIELSDLRAVLKTVSDETLGYILPPLNQYLSKHHKQHLSLVEACRFWDSRRSKTTIAGRKIAFSLAGFTRIRHLGDGAWSVRIYEPNCQPFTVETAIAKGLWHTAEAWMTGEDDNGRFIQLGYQE